MKKCFVIMPISDNPKYDVGHFNRVYIHIIKPACELAGFEPVRADEVNNTNHIAIDIVRKIINSDMAICDLSSRNPNVLYELGIRQSFDKPVTLIKDDITKRIFDIQGFRDIEYSSQLRIDNVQDTIDIIAENLKNTYESKSNEINSLIKLLSISSAKISHTTKISDETTIILNSIRSLENRFGVLESKVKNKYDRIYIRNTNDDDSMSIDEMLNLKEGDAVFQTRFGHGTVTKIEINKDNKRSSKIEIDFDISGKKRMVMGIVKLKKM